MAVVVLDCTKAFDLAKYDILFRRLLQQGMQAIVLRVLAYSYTEQVGWVRWGCSGTFGITNRTRQGSVASPAFWNVYLDPLFTMLREAGVGSHVGGLFVGAVGYADDQLICEDQRELRLCPLYAADIGSCQVLLGCLRQHLVGPEEQGGRDDDQRLADRP